MTIQNSVAYMNGYVLDEEGNLVDAGNGNGFKMGGSSITGGHKLINSVAFCNKAKGIDSNSCPDIQVTNSTSFNNGSYNVAFYTNDAANTAFIANGVISCRNDGVQDDQLKLKGTQDETLVYGTSNYYMINGVSTNTEGVIVDDTWFESVDADAAIGSSMTSNATDLISGITRNEDGTITMNGFLVLSDTAMTDTGANVEGEASASVEVTREEENGVKEAGENKPIENETSEELGGRFVRKWWNVYYQLSDGTYLTGLHMIDGQLYFFFDSGVMAYSSFVTRWIWNTYYFGSDGIMVTNEFVTANGNTYYFGDDGLMVRYWQNIDGKQYYFGDNGVMVKGCVELWWNIYVFDENGALIESHSVYERVYSLAKRLFGGKLVKI